MFTWDWLLGRTSLERERGTMTFLLLGIDAEAAAFDLRYISVLINSRSISDELKFRTPYAVLSNFSGLQGKLWQKSINVDSTIDSLFNTGPVEKPNASLKSPTKWGYECSFWYYYDCWVKVKSDAFGTEWEWPSRHDTSLFGPRTWNNPSRGPFYAKRINHLQNSLWFTNWFTKCWNGSSLKMQLSHCWWTDSTILFSPACLARYETADFCIKRNKQNIDKNPSWSIANILYVLQRDVDTKSSTFSRWFQNVTWSAWWISFS